MSMKRLLVLYSYHHKNTEAVAKAMSQVLGARIVAPRDVDPVELVGCDLVGFGAGIDSGKHYKPILDLADKLPASDGKRAFIFSTCGAPAFIVTEGFIRKNHSALRQKLEAKGYAIMGEFGCPGFNTNAFLKYFGGINRARPNAQDLERARAFARGLSQEAG